jgi:molecular chaperone DnaK
MSVAIGIDLGTTNTVVAAVVDGVAVTLQDEKGRRLLPSVVSFQPSGQVLVGEPAREKRLTDPENTIFSVKPLLGRPWDSEETQAARARFPFRLVQGAKNAIMVQARDIDYALPEISAFVLRRAKAIAEQALKQSVDKAVITVPANFNDLQRASTKIAGKLAGLEVMRILNEPTAAALAYGQTIKAAEKIAIYDLGGGTFDITLLDLTDSVFEVLGTAGDTKLGGDDVDRIIADRIIREVAANLRIDPRTNPASLARISFLAEEVKKELSTADVFDRELTGVAYKTDQRSPLSIPFKLHRNELEAAAMPLLQRTMDVTRQSMAAVGLTPRDFSRIILVGGATRMPLVPRVVEALFGKAPSLKVNPDEVVALGAAIQAHALNRAKSAHKNVVKAAPKPAPAPAPAAPPVPAKKPPPVPPAPPSSQKLPVYRPASSSKLPAVRPASTPGMAAVKPPPAVPRPAAKAEEHPASNEMMTLSKAAYSISWDLPGDAPPPASAPAPVLEPPPPPSSRRSIAELDVPDLDLTPAAGPTDIVAAPSADDDLELGLDIPSGPAGTQILAAPKVPPPPGFGGGTRIMAAPIVPPEQEVDLGFGASDVVPGPPEPEERLSFGQIDLAAAFAPERFAQGSAINTSANTPLLIDVTPLSLGVETVGGYADVLIPANSPVPCEKTRTFMTASDGQTSVTVRVAQGESPKFGGNTRLGDVELSGLRAARRGEVKISVTFELDADGILNVRARDPDTGRETVATMRLVGATNEVSDLNEMMGRQARHHVQ